MDSFIKKLKLIYLPYLLIAIGFISVYSFLNWLLVIQTGWLALKETWINFGLPFGLPAIPIWIWLRPRIKLLRLKRKNGKDLVDFYFFIAWITVSAPTVIAQEYLLTATGKLTELTTPSTLNSHSLTKYYTLKQYYIDKKHIGVYNKAEVSGKHNEHIDFNIYVACPILDHQPIVKQIAVNKGSVKLPELNLKHPLIIIDGVPSAPSRLNEINPQDVKSVNVLKEAAATAIYGMRAVDGAILIQLKTSNPPEDVFVAPDAWLGITYSKQISNRGSAQEKEQAFREFAESCEEKFKQENLSQFTYLDRIGNTENREGYTNALKRFNLNNEATPIFLELRHDPFAARNGNKLQWIFGAFGIGAGIWLIMLLFPKLANTEVIKFNKGINNRKESEFKDVAAFFIPNRQQWALPVIIDLNLLLYTAMVLAGLGFVNFDTEGVIKWGANYGPLTVNGEWWRLFTCTFLHGGIMHLLNNMYGLFFGAVFLVPLIGNKRFVISYVICGIVASFTSLYWHPMVISVGASGAIMGIFGINLALITTNRVPADAKKFLLINCVIFVGLTLLLGLAGGVDNAAHTGGLVCGLVIGYLLNFTASDWPKPPTQQPIENELTHEATLHE
ncbi:hypothetical protein GCM10027037_29950 [Mucilaginibacter koreensis]